MRTKTQVTRPATSGAHGPIRKSASRDGYAVERRVERALATIAPRTTTAAITLSSDGGGGAITYGFRQRTMYCAPAGTRQTLASSGRSADSTRGKRKRKSVRST